MDLLAIASTALVQSAPPDAQTVCACWLLHFADQESREVWFAPPVDLAEALDWYPEAIAAEPVL